MASLIIVVALLLTSPHRMQHPATPTRIDVTDLPAVLAAAHRDVFGRDPSRARLGMAIGQVRLEGLALPGRNLGALGATRGRPWVRLGKWHKLRAFDSYADAARAYWTLLAERCAGALYAFDSGDPDESAKRLRRCGYFRAPLDLYRAGLRALRR